jgi:F-type H+-transporting ATPase subunit c
MTKKLFYVLALMLIASTMLCAQGVGTPASSAKDWSVPVSAAFAMAIASGLCGLGQGKAVASAVEGIGRNPAAAQAIQLAMLIGLAFIESLALYTLLIVFLKVS